MFKTVTVALQAILMAFIYPSGGRADRETYKDLIQKAQNLSLQKDRLQATKILARGTVKEKGEGRRELIKTLKELSEVFYSDKGQQTFELGRSLAENSLATAIERFNEALAIETNNTLVMKSLARVYLKANSCDRSFDMASQGLVINPYDDEMVLIKAQASVCLNRTEYSKLVQELMDIKKGPLRVHAELLKALVLLNEGKLPAAEAQMDKALAADARFPETYFHLALLKKKSGRDSLEHWQKYLLLCADLTAELRRKYFAEPKLCSEKTNAEAEIEKIKTTQARHTL